MYRETLRQEKMHLLRLVITLALLLVVASSITWLGTRIVEKTQWYWIEAAPILLVVALAYWIYRRQCIAYRYTIIEDEVIFEQLSGTMSRVQLRVRVQDILEMKPYTGANKEKTLNEKMLLHESKRPIYQLFYQDGNKKRGILLQPTTTFIQKMEEEIQKTKTLCCNQ